MSASFYASVARLFTLLDVDQNGRLDRDEARLGFLSCFSAVHRDSEALDGNKEAIVSQQVDWLFTAAAGEAQPPSDIDEAAFKACYQKLLAAAYEEEVLSIDLQRAIDALTSSQDWQNARAVFTSVHALYAALATDRLIAGDVRHHAVLESLLQPITGRSSVMGPRSQTAARKLVAPLLAPDAQTSVDQLAATLKQVLAVPVPAIVLKQSAEESLRIASGDSSASAPMESS